MSTMTMTMGWAGRSAGSARAASARAYLKALRAAEQAAWERQIPGVEAVRWNSDPTGASWLPVLAGLALAGGVMWMLSGDAATGLVAGWRWALSWIPGLAG